MKEKEDIEPVESKKQRLASVTSSESFASSGFQEDKSLSDVEEDEEGRYLFLPVPTRTVIFLQHTVNP